MNKQQRYQQLLHNEKQLKALWHSTDPEHFVALMQTFLHWPELTFNGLIDFLQQQNRQFLLPELASFSRCWQPAEYKKKDQSVSWVPAFQPLQQPFYLDDMAQQRCNLLSQLIKPVTKVADILPQLPHLPVVTPALLIFHWSRCGSTLLGGLFRQLNGVKLLSESMLISELLLDPYWPDEQKPKLLQLGITLQGCFRHGEQQLVVKCNAWDLQHWSLWLQQYPAARVICLGRKPEQILASHQRISGMHMAGLPGIWQNVNPWLNCHSPLEGRIAVLRTLMHYTKQLLSQNNAVFLDYQHLLKQSPQQLTGYLGRVPDPTELQRWFSFSTLDAKQPALTFQAAASLAETAFNKAEQRHIRELLEPLYQSLSGTLSEYY